MQPSAHINPRMTNVRSRITQATNMSSNEHGSPVMNNITDKGLSTVEPEEGQPKHQSQITFQSLQEGDIFDKDIKRIMAIINGVEKQFNEKKISKDF